MATRTKSGLFSPISLAAVNLIATKCPNTPRLLIAYLVLARFTSLASIGMHASNTVSGAGAQAVSKVMAMRASRGSELIKKLIELGVIEKAQKGLVVGKFPATYVMKYRGDIHIPHALVDGLNGVAGIARLLKAGEGHTPQLVTTALIVLINCYRLHDMLEWSGVSPDAVHRGWQFHSQKPEGQGFNVRARRATASGAVLSQSFCEAIMESMGLQKQNLQTVLPNLEKAFGFLCSSGLIYEAVTLFDPHQAPFMPLRLNDVFAAVKQSEPSFIETISGAGFYTHANNEEGKQEGIQFLFPHDPCEKKCSIAGVMRLRFRCADPSTAQGLERDAANLKRTKQLLMKLDLIDNFEQLLEVGGI